MAEHRRASSRRNVRIVPQLCRTGWQRRREGKYALHWRSACGSHSEATKDLCTQARLRGLETTMHKRRTGPTVSTSGALYSPTLRKDSAVTEDSAGPVARELAGSKFIVALPKAVWSARPWLARQRRTFDGQFLRTAFHIPRRFESMRSERTRLRGSLGAFETSSLLFWPEELVLMSHVSDRSLKCFGNETRRMLCTVREDSGAACALEMHCRCAQVWRSVMPRIDRAGGAWPGRALYPRGAG